MLDQKSLPEWLQFRPMITPDDMIEAGLCPEGVYEWMNEVEFGTTATHWKEVESTIPDEHRDTAAKASRRDGYGHGDGYGDGDGYGHGDGDGYGYGHGDGDGYGYGHGDGYGDGYGHGYGYGYGHGDGYGDGDGDGYGSYGLNKA